MTEEELNELPVIVAPKEESEAEDVVAQVYMDIEHEDDYTGDLIEFCPKEPSAQPAPVATVPRVVAKPKRDFLDVILDAAEPLRGGRKFVATGNGVHLGLSGLMLFAGHEATNKDLELQYAQLELAYKDKQGNTHKLNKFIVADPSASED